MSNIFTLIFFILPVLELTLLIHIGSLIGAANTILLLLLNGVIGIYIARMQGLQMVYRMQTSLNEGRLPSEELLTGVLIFFSGILLLIPGFITDIIGLLLLIPLTRNLIKSIIRKKFQGPIYREEGPPHQHHSINQKKRDFEDADFS